MFYYYDQQERRMVVRRDQLLSVPKFLRLHQEFGFNALQYMIFFLGAAGPFFRTFDDVEERHGKVMEAIREFPWDAGARKIPQRFYENAVFKIAGEEFVDNHDDQIELRREAALNKTQRRMVKELEALLEKATLTEEDQSKIDSLTDRIAKQAKHYESVRTLAKNRIDSDDPTVLFADVTRT